MTTICTDCRRNDDGLCGHLLYLALVNPNDAAHARAVQYSRTANDRTLQRQLTDALTAHHHFEQAGFRALLK